MDSHVSLANHEARLNEVSRHERHITHYSRILEKLRSAAIQSVCR